MTIEMWAADRPVPYARNARKLNRHAVDSVAASLKEFGWRQAIVVDGEGVVVAGHTRLLAAKKLGMTEVPVHVAEGLSPEQIKAYRLADNRTHDNGEWDLDLVALEVAELNRLNYDVSQTAFAQSEVDACLRKAGQTGEDEMPAPAALCSITGDLWLLGPHRLLCGDSTLPANVERVLGGALPKLWESPADQSHDEQFAEDPQPFGEPGRNSSIWEAASPKMIMGGSDEEKYDHPTQKPVELMVRSIQNHTTRGETVYEPFSGSGTTMMAAEETGRICLGLEMDPKYVDVIVRRWQAFTGLHAYLDGTERTFDEIAATRTA